MLGIFLAAAQTGMAAVAFGGATGGIVMAFGQGRDRLVLDDLGDPALPGMAAG
jgi:hypothetical protein